MHTHPRAPWSDPTPPQARLSPISPPHRSARRLHTLPTQAQYLLDLARKREGVGSASDEAAGALPGVATRPDLELKFANRERWHEPWRVSAAWSKRPLGSTIAWLLHLLRARLAALGSLVLSERRLGTSGVETRPLGAKPLPRVLEQTASKVTDVTASDHLGDGGRLPHVQRGRLLRSEDTAGDQSRVRRWYGAAPLLAG